MIAAVLACTLLRPTATQGPFARDFEAYYAAGAVWDAGGDPWSRAVWTVERGINGVDAARDELLPYAGPAATLPLFGALARLSHPIAVRIWTALLGLAMLALVLAAFGLARDTRATAVVAALTFAIASGPGTSALALGQIALLSAAGIGCALLAFERGSIAGGALATLAAATQPNLAPALIARLRDRTALFGTGLAVLAFAALTWWAGDGARGVLDYAARLAHHADAERFVAIQHTPAAIAASFGVPGVWASALGDVCALAAIALVVIATIRFRLGPRDGAFLAIAALPLALPFFHEHDFVIALVPLTVLALTARRAARVGAGVAAIMIGVDWFGLAQHPAGGAQIIVLGAVVACAFAALGPGARSTRADLAPFVALALLAAPALLLGHAFLAPIWPDALPAHFHAPAHADASAVWAAEQHAAGLDAQVPAWGALRAIPLAGCVVLALAIILASRTPQASPPNDCFGRTGA